MLIIDEENQEGKIPDQTSVSSDRWRLRNSLMVAAISDVGSLTCTRESNETLPEKQKPINRGLRKYLG